MWLSVICMRYLRFRFLIFNHHVSVTRSVGWARSMARLGFYTLHVCVTHSVWYLATFHYLKIATASLSMWVLLTACRVHGESFRSVPIQFSSFQLRTTPTLGYPNIMSRYLIPVPVDNFNNSSECILLLSRILRNDLSRHIDKPCFCTCHHHQPPQQFFVILFWSRPQSVFRTPYTIFWALFIYIQWRFSSRSFRLEV